MNIIDNRTEWDKILKDQFFNLDDIYFEYDYFDLFTETYKAKPEGIFWEDDVIEIFWTHLVREINKLEYFKDTSYLDLVTPYGYGGPLIKIKKKNNNEVKNSILNFFNLYTNLMKEKNRISEFIRFHPLFNNWELFKEIFPVMYLNQVVAIDLTQSNDDIWKNMTKNTRYYTRKGLKEFKNVEITQNPSNSEIENFVNLYKGTMDKNQASQKYYFSKEFIKNHFKSKCLYIECKNNNEIIGAISLFLIGSKIMHYHLSATNYNVKNPPSRAILWHAIEWAKKKGLKWFHLGGGVGKEDNLFNFKKGFSKTYFMFYIGRIVHNNEIYQKLISLNPNINNEPNFFPSYRVGMDENII